jgi:hypothetical protein
MQIKVWFDYSCVRVRVWGVRNDLGIRVFTWVNTIYSEPFPLGPLFKKREEVY